MRGPVFSAVIRPWARLHAANDGHPGGGQGGIALAARLKRLEVPTIIIEKNERAGDSWRKRYKSLCLHDEIWQNHLPYLPEKYNA